MPEFKYKIGLKSRDITEVHPTAVPCSAPSCSGDAQCGTSAEGERETVRATINGGKVPLTAEKKKRNPFGATRRRREREKEGRKFVCRQFFFFFLGGGVDGHLLHSHRQQKSVTTDGRGRKQRKRGRAESSLAYSCLRLREKIG